MKLCFKFIFRFLFFALFPATCFSLSLDDKLHLIKELYGLEPRLCEVDADLMDESLSSIGEIVFNTPVLSGDKDMSCSVCHLDRMALTDGLPVAIGVGGEGEGMERFQSSGVIVPRNAFTLFGRASPHYLNFFWDGRVQESNGVIYSPVGDGYKVGFTSPLAVAAVLPILARDEFLGLQRTYGSSENLKLINDAYYEEKIEAANILIRKVVREPNDEDELRLANAFHAADVAEPNIQVVGNALASFIADKVSDCSPSPWEEYLDGNREALTDQQKRGAVTFFGNGRCASCHSGSLFSDFDFHSVGVPQGEFGPYIHGQDVGRASVTHDLNDRYKFRTPSLLYVSRTSPYGHNGVFKTLDEVVRFHLNPIPFFSEKGWSSDRELLSYGKLLSSRSDLLGFIDITTEDELSALVEYLKAL